MADPVRAWGGRILPFVDRALRATGRTGEIADPDGHQWRFHMNPRAAVSIELVRADDEHARIVQVLARKRRPAAYPDDLPYVPGHHATIEYGIGGVRVAWVPDATHIPPARPEMTAEQMQRFQTPALVEFSERLRPIAERARAGDAEARAELKRLTADFRAQHADEIRELQETWSAAFGGSEARAAVRERVEHLVRQSAAVGWMPVVQTEDDERGGAIVVELTREGATRHVEGLALGPMQLLVMDQSATGAT